MIIVMKHNASKQEIGNLTDHLTTCGYRLTISEGVERTVIGAIGDESLLKGKQVQTFPGVDEIIPISKPYKLVSREFKKEDTVIDVKGIKIGDGFEPSPICIVAYFFSFLEKCSHKSFHKLGIVMSYSVCF